MLLISNQATQDNYVDALTLGPVASAQKIAYLVANNAAIVQVAGHSDDKTIQPWGDEILVTPTTGEFQRIQGMRFRSAVPGSPAQIVAQLVEPNDPVPVGGTPFTQILTPSGSITPVSEITRVTVLPATPVDGQVVTLVVDAVNFPGVEWLLIFNASTSYWDFIGGSPLIVSATTALPGTSTWTNLVSLTLAHAGDYQFDGGYFASYNAAGAGTQFAGLGKNGVNVGTTGAVSVNATGAGFDFGVQSVPANVTVTAGQTINFQGWSNVAVSAPFASMSGKPVRNQ